MGIQQHPNTEQQRTVVSRCNSTLYENMDNLTTSSTSTLDNRSVPKESCFFLLDPKFHKVHDRYATNLLTGVLNAVLSPCAIIANLLIVLVIIKKVSLRSPLNLLLGCLAVSDFLVGLFVQPSYVAFRLGENQHKIVPCALRLFYSTGFFICYGVSLVTLCAISCERFLALFYPLQYRHFIRFSRVLKLVIFIWTVNIFLTGLQWAHNKAARGFHLVSWLVLLLIALVSQLRILPLIRRHQKQIKRHERYSHCHRNVASLMQLKFAANIACIVTVYLAFNLPVLLITAFHQIIHVDIDTYNLYSWAETAAFVNSFLNPLICVWRVKAIWRTIREFCCRRKQRRVAYLSSFELPSNDVVLVKFRQVQEPQLVILNSCFASKDGFVVN